MLLMLCLLVLAGPGQAQQRRKPTARASPPASAQPQKQGPAGARAPRQPAPDSENQPGAEPNPGKEKASLGQLNVIKEKLTVKKSRHSGHFAPSCGASKPACSKPRQQVLQTQQTWPS
ncbi:MAG: hypothetical protein WKG07_16240 [Hymenobacter sp.]